MWKSAQELLLLMKPNDPDIWNKKPIADHKTMKCPKCKSLDVVEFATKYTEKGYWCDDCDHEWVVE